MCGRFALHATLEDIQTHFKLRESFRMQARYNIAPTQTIPIITQYQGGITFSRWSYLPSWAKGGADDSIPVGYSNARSETLMEKPAFRDAFLKQRCIIPVSGYYEWMPIKDKKQPFYITVKEHPIIGLAGIWSVWKKSNWDKVMTCAIITAPAHPYLSRIHDRMPLVINPALYRDWLNPAKRFTELTDVMLNENDSQWLAYPVSTQVNSPKIDTPACIVSL